MLENILAKTMGFVKEHSPELLIGTGVVGMATSTVLAVRATPIALQLMEDKKADLGVTYLTKKEIVETTWRQYVPAAGIGAVSAACIILGTTKSLQRNTALATVYAISEGTLKEYQKKTKEIVGEEKAREIDREVSKARVRERERTVVEVDGSEYIHNTGYGDTRIYDSLSGRYFRSSKNAVESAVNAVNKNLLEEYTVSVNDFYNELNVPTNDAGNLIGWKSDKDMLEVNFDSDVDKFGNPFLIIYYYSRPVPLHEYSQGW